MGEAGQRSSSADTRRCRPVLSPSLPRHTSACIDLSPYKWKGVGGGGRPAHVHVLPQPDSYRGSHLDGAAAARAAVEAAEAAGGRLAAFFAESILSCGGQVRLGGGSAGRSSCWSAACCTGR